MIIRAITVVTAQGVAQFEVGRFGIKEISEHQKQIAEYSYLMFYRVKFDNGNMTDISASCPLQIDYIKP